MLLPEPLTASQHAMQEPPPEPEPTLAMEHAWNVIVVDGQEMLVDSCAAVYLASESGEVSSPGGIKSAFRSACLSDACQEIHLYL